MKMNPQKMKLRSFISVLFRAIRKKEIDLSYEGLQGAPVFVICDKEKFEQIIVLLVTLLIKTVSSLGKVRLIAGKPRFRPKFAQPSENQMILPF